MQGLSFGIVILICAEIFTQFRFWLEKPKETNRLRFVFLLIFIVVHNCIIFYSDLLSLSLNIKVIFINFFELTMFCYYSYFFYKAFDLKDLKVLFPGIIALLLTLFSFIVSFFARSVFESPEYLQSKGAILIAFSCSLPLVYGVGRLLTKRFKNPSIQSPGEENIWFLVASFLSLLGWALFPILTLFPNELLSNKEAILFTDIVFLFTIIAHLVISKFRVIQEQARLQKMEKEKDELTLALHSLQNIEIKWLKIQRVLGLSTIEQDVLIAFVENSECTNKDIAGKVNQSLSRIKQHVASILEKCRRFEKSGKITNMKAVINIVYKISVS
jgi:hypothetical protein